MMDLSDFEFEEEPNDIKTPVETVESIEKAARELEQHGTEIDPPAHRASSSTELPILPDSADIDPEPSIMQIVAEHPSLQPTPRRLVRRPSDIVAASTNKRAADEPIPLPIAKFRRLRGKGPCLRYTEPNAALAEALLGPEMKKSVQNVRSMLKDTVCVGDYDHEDSLDRLHNALFNLCTGYRKQLAKKKSSKMNKVRQ